MGFLHVLNCSAGHMKFTFDKNDLLETERAKRVIRDMLRRGYSLFIETGEDKKLVRAKGFDEATESYIIAAGPDITEATEIAYADTDIKETQATTSETTGEGSQRRRERTKKVPMRHARTTAIAPTSGG